MYDVRTLISHGQKYRKKKMRTKYNTEKGVLEGQSCIIVDDSIVRGTTSRYLVDMIRAAKPYEIHFLGSSPPITHPCFYGMDFPDPNELIANRFNRDIEAIAQVIGVDSLRYLSPDGVVNTVQVANVSEYYERTAWFTGK